MDNYQQEIWQGWALTKLANMKAGGAKGRATTRIKQKITSEQLVIKTVEKTRPDLIVGQKDARVTKDEVDNWLQTLKPEKSSVRERRDRQNFLIRALRKGQQELGWDAYIPPIVTVIHHETNPFAYSALKDLTEATKTQKAVWSWLNVGENMEQLLFRYKPPKNVKVEPRYISWGLVLFSLITNDNVLNQRDLAGILASLNDVTSIKSIAHHFTDLDPALLQEKKSKPLKRIYLSHVTLLLIAQHLQYFGFTNTKDLNDAKKTNQKCWSVFVRIASETRAPLSSFINGVATRSRFTTPSYLSSFAEGVIRTTSISSQRLAQLSVNGARSTKIKTLDAHNQKTSSNIKWQYSRDSKHKDLDQSILSLKKVRRALYKAREQKAPTFKTISKNLEELLSESRLYLPIIQCLIAWIYSEHLSKKKKRSTLYENFNRISRHLVLAIKGTDLSNPESIDILSAAYDEIIENGVSADDRSKKAGLLNSFHRFISTIFNLPKTHIASSQESSKSVDANVISETEYNLTKHSLSLLPDSQQNRSEIFWIFVLGYRAGLRAGEASTIHLNDLIYNPNDPTEEFLLIIRPNAFQTVKSSDGRRLLPLHLLLDEKELKQFQKYAHNKTLRFGNDKSLLFGSIPDPTRPNRDQDVFPIIHRAMRNITGCIEPRFHHLRHSLANALLFALEEVIAPYPAPKHLIHTKHLLGEHKTKKNLFFIAQLLGHSSPDVTAQSYLHFFDYLTMSVKSKSIDIPDALIAQPIQCSEFQQVNLIAKLLGKNEATLRKWKQRYGACPKEFALRLIDISTHVKQLTPDLTPYAQVIAEAPIQQRIINDLALSEIAKSIALAKEQRSASDIDFAFSLPPGSYDALEEAYVKIGLAGNQRAKHSAKTSFRHIKPSSLSDETRSGWISSTGRNMITIPSPHGDKNTLAATQAFEELSKLSKQKETKQPLRENLLFFYKNHRASENRIRINEMEGGIKFINWLSSLKLRDVQLRLTILPTKSSQLSPKEQLNEWKQRINASAKIESEISLPNKENRQTYGTGYLTILCGSEKTGGGASIRYALLMRCIIETTNRIIFQRNA